MIDNTIKGGKPCAGNLPVRLNEEAFASETPRRNNQLYTCKNCGKNMPMGSNYCSACGRKIENISEIPEPKVTSVEKHDALRVCELCGVKATKVVEFKMYKIDDSSYLPLAGRRFRYRSKKEIVWLCDACHSSITKYDFILGTIALLAWIGLFSFFVSLGIKHGVFQFIMEGVLSFIFIGFLMAPFIFIFSSERRAGRKVKRIADMRKKGWKFGSKPTKSDLFAP